MSAKQLAQLLSRELDLFLFFELLGQMVIVEVLVLPFGQLHDPFEEFLLDLAFARSSSVAMNYFRGSSLIDPRFDLVDRR